MNHYFRNVFIICLWLIPIIGFGQKDDIFDPTFSDDGIFRFHVQDWSTITAVLERSDHAIILAGMAGGDANFSVMTAALDPSGKLDSSYGINGVTICSVPGRQMIYQCGAALQPDGKLVIAGNCTNDINPYHSSICLFRFLTNGQPDTSFGVQGISISPFYSGYGTFRQTIAVFVLPDGRLLVCGDKKEVTNYDQQFSVECYLSDGTIDTTFGNHGDCSITPDDDFNDPECAVLQSDGKIIIGGNSYADEPIILVRINSDGTADTTFGNNGVVNYFPNAYTGYLDDIYITHDGHILCANTTYDNDYNALGSIAHFNSDGSIDQRYGIYGQEVYDSCGNIIFHRMPDGSFYSGCDLTHYWADKSVDSTFGKNGSILLPCYAPVLTIDHSGKLLIGGYASDASGDAWISRYVNGPFPQVQDEPLHCYLFPNPAGDECHIQFTQLTGYPISVAICDASGKKINTFTADGNKQQVPFSTAGLPHGIYFILLESNGIHSGLTMIKQ